MMLWWVRSIQRANLKKDYKQKHKTKIKKEHLKNIYIGLKTYSYIKKQKTLSKHVERKSIKQTKLEHIYIYI